MEETLKERLRMIIREELQSLVEASVKFDPKKVEKLITQDNEAVVEQLNSIVILLNRMRSEKNTDHGELSKIWRELKAFF